MSEKQQHSKIIDKVARALLAPEGVRQKGRSRVWLDDHGYWLVVIEFQPSSWSRGSYLNVGCMWLFYPQDYIAFHEGYREKSFVEYRDDAQFEESAVSLVIAALDKIRDYRKRFSSLASIQSHLTSTARKDDFWSLYFAGVASGLVGKTTKAASFFTQITNLDCSTDWQKEIKERAERCLIMLTEKSTFTNQIWSYTNHTRQALKLEPTPSLLDEGMSI